MIVFLDEAVDGGLQIEDGGEDAMLQGSTGEFCEEALDGVEPGAGGRCEVECPPWMPSERGAHLIMLMDTSIFRIFPGVLMDVTSAGLFGARVGRHFRR